MGSVAASHVTRMGEGILLQGEGLMPGWLTDKGSAGSEQSCPGS